MQTANNNNTTNSGNKWEIAAQSAREKVVTYSATPTAEIMTLSDNDDVQALQNGDESELTLVQPLANGETGAVTNSNSHSNSNSNEAEAVASAISFEDVRFDFIHSASTGDVEQLKLILDMKIDVNVADDDGYPALVLASCYGHDAVVMQLLAEPAIDVNLMANDGCTALQVAAQDGFEEVTRLLIAAKADLNLAVKGAAGPLFLAAQEGENMHANSRFFWFLLL